MKVFVPFSEALIAETGIPVGELVPFQLEYQCLRLNEAGQFLLQPEPVEEPGTKDPSK